MEKNCLAGYFREFQAYVDDVCVLASYMPWYCDGFWIEDYDFTDMPLLGAYDVRDPLTICKHVDWAKGFGVDVFLMNWTTIGDEQDKNIKKILENMNQNINCRIDIAILWGPDPEKMINSPPPDHPDWDLYDMSNEFNQNVFLNDMKYLAETYFTNRLYFKLSGRPVIYFYNSKSMRGPLPKLIKLARKEIENLIGAEPFIIGDEIGWLFTYPEDWINVDDNSLERLTAFDAISDWAGSHDRSDPEYIEKYEEYLDILYSKWSEFLIKNDVGFVPSAIPGFYEIYKGYERNYPPIPRSPEKFRERLRIAMKYMDPKLKIIRIDTWNDWGEWTNIEPMKKEKFTYLEVLKNVLKDSNNL